MILSMAKLLTRRLSAANRETEDCSETLQLERPGMSTIFWEREMYRLMLSGESRLFAPLKTSTSPE